MKDPVDQLLDNHQPLVHSEMKKVNSHVQRREGEWLINTLMIEGCSVPFKYTRKKPYQSLVGQRVNLTYYPASERVAGMSFEVMNVVRVKRS